MVLACRIHVPSYLWGTLTSDNICVLLDPDYFNSQVVLGAPALKGLKCVPAWRYVQHTWHC